MCSHGIVWEFFRDQGGIIAGVFALIAGGMAYMVGQKQATATTQAAATQVAAVNAQNQILQQQLRDARQAAETRAETDRRTIIFALSIEAARINRLARDRLLVAQNRYLDESSTAPIHREIEPYVIEAGEVLRHFNVLSLGNTDLTRAASQLNSMVDILNSALTSAGRVSLLSVNALIGHIRNIITTSERLRDAAAAAEATLRSP